MTVRFILEASRSDDTEYRLEFLLEGYEGYGVPMAVDR